MSWTIGELGRRSGVAASTLRFWERSGLLPSPQRVGGQRRYESAALETVALIRLAQAAGCSIGDIRELLIESEPDRAPAERWTALAERRAADLDARIAALLRTRQTLTALTTCTCASLTECVRRVPRAHV